MAKPRQPKTPEMRVLDPASIAILKKAEADGVDTAFSRMDTQSVQCKFGSQGSCCRICHMGPCRITAKTPLDSMYSCVSAVLLTATASCGGASVICITAFDIWPLVLSPLR